MLKKAQQEYEVTLRCAGEADQLAFWSEVHAAITGLLASQTWENRCGGLLLLKVPVPDLHMVSHKGVLPARRRCGCVTALLTVQVALLHWPSVEGSMVDDFLAACVALLEVCQGTPSVLMVGTLKDEGRHG